jgi:hypothetical protein
LGELDASTRSATIRRHASKGFISQPALKLLRNTADLLPLHLLLTPPKAKQIKSRSEPKNGKPKPKNSTRLGTLCWNSSTRSS